MPLELRYVWEWFCELCRPDPLAYAEIAAWSQLTNTPVMPWEVRLIKSLDRKRQQIMHEDL